MQGILTAATMEVSSRPPGMMRQRVKATHQVDASHRLLGRREPLRHRAQGCASVGTAKLAQSLRALLCFPESRGRARRVQRLNRFGGIAESLLPGDVAHRQRGASQRLLEGLKDSIVFRAAIPDRKGGFLPSDIGEPRRVVERMQRTRQPKLLFF
ncbi:MAG: hypothetical protein JO068_18640 [Hyphomicrobiales bacterium]|nr:hypothetical protein [Hyphomicrobiales bacterium]